MRVIRKQDGWILLLRNDCPLFDPNKCMEQYNDIDACANFGLKMLRGISSEIIYLNTLNLNNLIIRIG